MTHPELPGADEIKGNLIALNALSGIPLSSIQGFRFPYLNYSALVDPVRNLLLYLKSDSRSPSRLTVKVSQLCTSSDSPTTRARLRPLPSTLRPLTRSGTFIPSCSPLSIVQRSCSPFPFDIQALHTRQRTRQRLQHLRGNLLWRARFGRILGNPTVCAV